MHAIHDLKDSSAKNLTARTNAKSGFALIEIIVAVMIIGIMVGLGFGALRWIEDAKRKKNQVKMEQLQLYIRNYETNTNEYPSKLEDLAVKPANIKGWNGPYAGEDDMKDAWGNEFQYQKNPKGAKTPYQLYSFGKKGPDAPESEYLTAEPQH